MLYTRRGDEGDTSAFNCDQRFSKSSELAEALGAVDEINSFLGIIKTKPQSSEINIKIDGNNKSLPEIIEQFQQDLFIIQASLGGADKKITKEKILYLEKIIDDIEKEMLPIKTFLLSGGTEISAFLDYARAVARRAERRVVALSEKDKLNENILVYLNRFSSLLYALARIVNAISDAKQIPPSY
jgi:cob(I)alamin adenosyltransferase